MIPKAALGKMYTDRGRSQAEENSPPLEKLDIQHIIYSQDLFLEVDEFVVQVTSTLDYLAKLPLAIIGKNNWPYLRTFGSKGQ